MSLVPSLLQAIVRVDGEALVLHPGDKPYVVSPTGQVDLASRGLTLEAVNGIVDQLLPIELQNALDEFGAVQHELAPLPEFPGEHFTVVAARGGDDVWAEIRRRRIPEDDRVPDEFFASPPEPAAVQAAAEATSPMAMGAVASVPVYDDDELPVEMLGFDTPPVEQIASGVDAVAGMQVDAKGAGADDLMLPDEKELWAGATTPAAGHEAESTTASRVWDEPVEIDLDAATEEIPAEPHTEALPAIAAAEEAARIAAEEEAQREAARVAAEEEAAREAARVAAAEEAAREAARAAAAEEAARQAARVAAEAEAQREAARVAAQEAAAREAARVAAAEEAAREAARVAAAEEAAREAARVAAEAEAQCEAARVAAAEEAAREAARVVAQEQAAREAARVAAAEEAAREAARAAAAEEAAREAARVAAEAEAQREAARVAAAEAAREAARVAAAEEAAREAARVAAQEEAAREAARVAAAEEAAREAARVAAEAEAQREAARVAAAEEAAREAARLAAEEAAREAARVAAAEEAAREAARVAAAEEAAREAARAAAAEKAARQAARLAAAEEAARAAAAEQAAREAARVAAAEAAREAARVAAEAEVQREAAREAARVAAAEEVAREAARAAAAEKAARQAARFAAAEEAARAAAAEQAAREAARVAAAEAAREAARVAAVEEAAREAARAAAAEEAAREAARVAAEAEAQREAARVAAAEEAAREAARLAAEEAAREAARVAAAEEAARQAARVAAAADAAREAARVAALEEAVRQAARAAAAQEAAREAARVAAAEEAQREMPPIAASAEAGHQTPLQPAVVLTIARNPIRSETPPPLVEDPTLSGLERLLRVSSARGASTLYLSSSSRPCVRVDGELQMLDGEPVLVPRDVESLLLTLMPERSHEALRTGAATEWICDLEGVGRVRCMSFRDQRGPGGVFRLMPTRSVSADQIGLPQAVQALAIEPEGLVLVAGPRSSGKRTTLSAFVDLMNRTRRDHIITIEREINIQHERGNSFISQREVRGSDEDVLVAARAAMREDPDVLVIEELRTGALMNVALEAAAAGRLVVGGFTAHTATGAVDRIIDLYAPEYHRQVQMALADSMRGVIAQVLLRKIGGGRLPAREVLLNTPAVSGAIAEGKTSQLPMAIEGGRRYGMMPINDALVGLVQHGSVEASEAYRHSPDRAGFLAALNRNGIDTSFVERLANG